VYYADLGERLPNYKEKITYLIMFSSAFLTLFFFYLGQNYVYAGGIRNYTSPQFFIYHFLSMGFCILTFSIGLIKIAEL